jgi:DNA-binding transcriptional ArsR family regulator
MSSASTPNLSYTWDVGTGYDFFVSLYVLHYPAKFGLRGAWAAGVRSRLPQDEREFLEGVYGIMPLNYRWVYHLPEPKDVETVLYNLKQVPAQARLHSLYFVPGLESPIDERLQAVTERGKWDEKDREFINKEFKAGEEEGYRLTPRQLEQVLNYYADSAAYGELLLSALQTYYDEFFAEEEGRILPKLEAALAEAQALAKNAGSPADLLEELSRGLRYEEMPPGKTLVLTPSYWVTPLVMWERLNKDDLVYLFAARPVGESLVPGEIVPDDLLSALKALADPTRLRILRYLMQENLSPAELSRRLRLRAPTVTHHLHTLRLAGLVRFVIKGKHERLYSARMESIQLGYSMLKDFLERDVYEDESAETERFERGRMF